ncbi:Uncharacterized protein APZ42_002771 [Daphnia magna]|uniref:Uncharacterized protein n=1 Tax=Daphnia magna TaxID=35525 RepID=A0A0N8DHE6_9CRUS|nr:Uncharacterized protein APZ42_002771 [Daphnia magna]
MPAWVQRYIKHSKKPVDKVIDATHETKCHQREEMCQNGYFVYLGIFYFFPVSFLGNFQKITTQDFSSF